MQLNRTLTADQFDVGRGLIKADRNNISPRVGFAQRLDNANKTVLRGGFGIFHPTGAAQGARDIMSRNPFRYTIRFTRPELQRGFTSGTRIESLGFGNQGLALDLELPDIYQYNVTLERELPGGLGARVSYIGSSMRKLLVNRDYNTLQASAVPLGDVDSDPAARARLPFPIYGTFMDITENSGEGQFNALQLELQRRFRSGFAANAAYTLASSDSNAPDSGNSTIGVIQYDPYDIEKDRGPDPNVVKHRFVMNSTFDIPLGRERPLGRNLPLWADAIVGGWTVSTIRPGALGTEPHPLLHLRRHRQHLPCQHRPDAGRRGAVRRGVASGRHGRPEHRREPRQVLRSDRVHAAGPGFAWECHARGASRARAPGS